MGLFDWLHKKPLPTYTDPTFGVLRYERGWWWGQVAFPPTGVDVGISLESDGSDPSVLYAGVFAELVSRYPTLRPEISAVLFELWKPWLENWSGDRPPQATSPEAMLRLMTIDSVAFELPARVELHYGFLEGGDWDDATFTVELTDWRISDRGLSD